MFRLAGQESIKFQIIFQSCIWSSWISIKSLILILIGLCTLACGKTTINILNGYPVNTSNGSSSCPNDSTYGEYIRVPGDATFGTSEFCVMKYEARLWHSDDVSGDNIVDDGNLDTRDGLADNYHTDYAISAERAKYRAVSTSAGRPWVNIKRGQNTTVSDRGAIEACQALGSNFDLISNQQWQTIARNIEGVGSNWDLDSFGDTILNRGHADNNPAQACDSLQEYIDTDCANTGSETDFEDKRTHSLSNGNIIWDFAGNVWEWLKDNNSTRVMNGLDYYFYEINSNHGAFTSHPEFGTYASLGDFLGPSQLPHPNCSNPTLNNLCGFGRVLGLKAKSFGSDFRPVLVDIDGDGDLDAFGGEQDGIINFFENQGTNTNAQFVETEGSANPLNGEDVGFFSAPAFVDIDNDGDFDAFVGELSGNINFYQNQGSTTVPNFVLVTGASDPFDGVAVGTRSAPSFVDIDNDGDFDAFIGENGGTILFYENQGNAANPNFVAIVGAGNPFDGVDVGSESIPSFVDIDNDGDFDAFIGDVSNPVSYYENQGTNIAPTFVLVAGAGDPFNGFVTAHAPTFGDLDNDGDFDALIGSDFGAYFNYYENAGTALVPSYVNNVIGTRPTSQIDVGDRSAVRAEDIDNDGDLDLFIGNADGFILYFENQGSATVPNYVEIVGAGNPFNGVDVGAYSAPSFVDIDNDGDLDAFVGESGGTILFYENQGTVSVPNFVAVVGAGNPLNGEDVGYNAGPDFADMDNDGDYDLIVAAGAGTFLYYENQGSAAAATFVNIAGAGNPLDGENNGPEPSIAIGDIDGDGDFDVITGENSGVINYYENQGTVFAPTLVAQTGAANILGAIDVHQFSMPDFVDYDGDGDLDVYIGRTYGQVYVMKNYGSSTTPIYGEMFEVDVGPFTTSSGHTMRGGDYTDQTRSGVFSYAYLLNVSSNVTARGFRCVYNF